MYAKIVALALAALALVGGDALAQDHGARLESPAYRVPAELQDGWRAARASEQARQSALALTHATIVDVESGRLLRDHTVLVGKNRIQAVGPASSISIPEGAEVIDARGKYLIPGLWDMHVHVASERDLPFDLFPAFGVTSIRDLGGPITVLRLLRQELEAGEHPAPRLFFCGPNLDGNAPSWPADAVIADTPEQGRTSVRFLAEQGVDCIKANDRLDSHILAPVVEAANAESLPVTIHLAPSMSLRAAIELGVRGIEHLHLGPGDVSGFIPPAGFDTLALEGRQALLWQRLEEQSAEWKQLIELLATRRIFLDPTLTIDEGNNLLSPAEQVAHPANAMLPNSLFARWSDGVTATTPRVPADLREAAADGVRKRRRFVKAASDAGAPLLAGSGGPWLGSFLPGLALHHELTLLAESGMQPVKALQAATINAARALGRDTELGSIAEGKLADLVLLDANPLEDIRSTQRIRAVVLNGRYLDREALDALLVEAERAVK